MRLKSRNEQFRHGSAGFADFAAIQRAGFTQSGADKILLGFHDNSDIRIPGQGGIVTCGGARSGKLACATAFTALGACWDSHSVWLDIKSETAAISQLAVTMANRHGIYWSPVKMIGAPTQHRIATMDYIHADSPSLISDIQTFCQNWIPKSQGKNSAFFDGQAQLQLEAIIIGLVKRDGFVNLPNLYEAVMLAGTGGEEFLDRLGFYMSICTEHAHVRRIEEKLAQLHAQGSNETYDGIYGVMSNSVACLSDPVLRESLTPYPDGSYDFSFEDMVSDKNLYSLFICVPHENLQTWSPVIKSIFVAGRIWKSRNPFSKPQLWVLDECGNLGGGEFPLAVELFTICAGLNLKPWAIFQSQKQIANLGKNAEHILLSSAQTQQYFGVRDFDTASALSRRIGAETLRYEDEHLRAKAKHSRMQALYGMLRGEDPMEAIMRARHHAHMHETPQTQRRMVMNADEILNMPSNEQVIFTDNIGAPIRCEKRAYYDQELMAGTYLPNPYHPPHDRVRIKTRRGYDWLRVVTEPVPPQYAHLPQYKDGYWTRLAPMS